MSNEEPEPTWQDSHPVLGLVVGTLDGIQQQKNAIKKLIVAVETLDARVRTIEDRLAGKRKKAKIRSSKESNPSGENDKTEESR